MMFSLDDVIERLETAVDTDGNINLTREVIYMAVGYLRRYDKITNPLIEYCESDDCCGDEQDIDKYFNRILVAFREPIIAHGINPVNSQPCRFCSEHCEGDTLYESSDWDGGIGFDYIRDVKYCPICGRKLLSDLRSK